MSLIFIFFNYCRSHMQKKLAVLLCFCTFQFCYSRTFINFCAFYYTWLWDLRSFSLSCFSILQYNSFCGITLSLSRSNFKAHFMFLSLHIIKFPQNAFAGLHLYKSPTIILWGDKLRPHYQFEYQITEHEFCHLNISL